MKPFSRRTVLTAMAVTGASTLAPRRLISAQAPATANLTSPASSTAAPILSSAEREKATKKIMDYFVGTVPKLLRPAKGLLAHDNIAPSLPGKQYSTTLWDWDTLWTTKGLLRFADLTHDDAFRASIATHAQGSLLIFLENAGQEGRIPMLITETNADPLDCLKPAPLPNHKNQAKPIFGQLALLAADAAKDVQWLAPHFDKLKKFYNSWTANNLSQIGLLVWGDDVAIGNDNDPTTFGRPFFSSANLLLNTLYYRDLQATAELARRLNRPDDAAKLDAQAKTLGENLLNYCWDSRDRFFYTADVQCVDMRAKLILNVKPGMDMSWKSIPIRIQTFTGFLPLWCQLATKEQAAALVQTNYVADERFRGDYGVRSLSSLESMYCMNFSSNPSNWLGPVWIIVNYLTWQGLKNYGYDNEARDLADKTLKLLAADLDAHGSLNEYYHPDTGAALSHAGFMDWNLLVMEMM